MPMLRHPPDRRRRKPRKAERAAEAVSLEQIPNVGPSLADDLRCIGINVPVQLIGRNPYELYDKLCARTGMRHDPCVYDVFIAAVRFMEGGPAAPWWQFTSERKRHLANKD